MPNEHMRKAQETTTQQLKVLEEIEKAGAMFFITDLELALTLTRIAGDAAENSATKARNQANARHAYDEISRISYGAVLTDNDRGDVANKLAELRSALEQLGEKFALDSASC
jgi:hypothetical protein